MRSFLEKQMIFEDEEVQTDDTGAAGQETNGVGEKAQKVVFRSFSTAEDEDKLLPESLKAFKKEELELQEKCCKTADVRPRAAKRLVNVFKLLKIIWFHRGKLHEPDFDNKRSMILLLALSAKQPVIMRFLLSGNFDALPAQAG